MQEVLSEYRQSEVFGKRLGCDIEIIIVTTNIPTSKGLDTGIIDDELEDSLFYGKYSEEVELTHIAQIREVLELYKDKECYVRVGAKSSMHTNGHYIRTRLQFGDKDKVITMEQYKRATGDYIERR